MGGWGDRRCPPQAAGRWAAGGTWPWGRPAPAPGRPWARQASDVLHINFPAPAFAKRSSNPVSGIDEGGKRIRRSLIPPFQLRLVQPGLSPVRAPLHGGPGRPCLRWGPGRLQCGPLPYGVPGRGCGQQPRRPVPGSVVAQLRVTLAGKFLAWSTGGGRVASAVHSDPVSSPALLRGSSGLTQADLGSQLPPAAIGPAAPSALVVIKRVRVGPRQPHASLL